MEERSPMLGTYPWLVYSHEECNGDQTFCTVLDPIKRQFRKIPDLCNKIFLTSCYGWCLLFDKDDSCFCLWNPLTLEKIKLPPLKFQGSIHQCTLSTTPKDPTCMVLLFAGNHPSIIYCHLGDEQWIEVKYEEELKRCLQENGEWDDDELETTLSYPFICNGNIYALSFEKGRLLLIHEMKSDSIGIRSLHVRYPLGQPHAISFSKWLIEYCGEVYGIVLKFGGICYKEVVAVEVHRLDFSQMVWEKLEKAKDLAFFIGDNCSVCCPAIKPEIEGNRVYFTLHEGENLYSYNIEDGTLSVSQPFPNLPTPRSSSFWLIPNHWLTSEQEESKLRIDKEEEDQLQVGGGERKKNEVVGKECAKQTYFSVLPSDIVSLIAERLILVDYLHFRATCRKFRSVAPPIQWKKAFNGLETHSLSPWLMCFEKDSVCTFIDPMHSDKYLINLPESLLGCVICYSKDGYFLMSRGKDSTFYFNPFTREILQFPKVPAFGLDTRCIGVSSAPTSSDCMLVEIYKFHPGVTVHFAYLGAEEWHCNQFNDDTDFRFYNNSPVFCNGAFCYLGQDGNLGVLDLTDERVTWEVLRNPERPCNSYHQNFLVECDGELLSVFVGHFGKWVRVFRLDYATMSWMEVESLGKNMIFVSRSSSFSAEAKTPGMENKIYFPRFHGQSIVFYSLDTKKYHTFESKDSPVDFYSTREQLHCGWIEPRWC